LKTFAKCIILAEFIYNKAAKPNSHFKFNVPRFREISIIKERKPDKKVKYEFCNNNGSRLKKYSNLIINVKLKSCYMEGQQRLLTFSNLNPSTP
jgi:hypothetical protein